MPSSAEHGESNAAIQAQAPTTGPRRARDYLARILNALPEGRSLPEETWRRRHQGILVLLWLQAVGLAVFALAMGTDLAHSVFEGGVVALMALVATPRKLGRTLRAVT